MSEVEGLLLGDIVKSRRARGTREETPTRRQTRERRALLSSPPHGFASRSQARDIPDRLTAVDAPCFKKKSIATIERLPDVKGLKVHMLAPIGPFTDPNERFSCPFVYFSE